MYQLKTTTITLSWASSVLPEMIRPSANSHSSSAQACINSLPSVCRSSTNMTAKPCTRCNGKKFIRSNITYSIPSISVKEDGGVCVCVCVGGGGGGEYWGHMPPISTAYPFTLHVDKVQFTSYVC